MPSRRGARQLYQLGTATACLPRASTVDGRSKNELGKDQKHLRRVEPDRLRYRWALQKKSPIDMSWAQSTEKAKRALVPVTRPRPNQSASRYMNRNRPQLLVRGHRSWRLQSRQSLAIS